IIFVRTDPNVTSQKFRFLAHSVATLLPFGCGERYLLSQNQRDSDHMIRYLILFGSSTKKP
ncbi:hypothetical protein, partial [Escherichia coli]|uniref:hypothetical protein n=1 Tax=Escherichia coli TaxID=562 RepID=UPI003747DB15